MPNSQKSNFAASNRKIIKWLLKRTRNNPNYFFKVISTTLAFMFSGLRNCFSRASVTLGPSRIIIWTASSSPMFWSSNFSIRSKSACKYKRRLKSTEKVRTLFTPSIDLTSFFEFDMIFFFFHYYPFALCILFFADLPVLQWLRPDFSNLPCFYSTFHLEYHSVLSRFCLESRGGEVVKFWACGARGLGGLAATF